ncbi:MAG TPA: glycosyltransferase family 39 protein [Streptosporangiaceae bacterium]|nr:glycosyltransferase family 39 protein [Streptosporangiaceae bacterium]
MRERIAESWALWSVLAAQATLTLPWMWRTAAYTDEAMYLSASHSGLSHLMSYAASFPGAPLLYPPVAAVFDSAGGLIAARLLSLIFMLGATVLIYLIGDRLFGQIPGILAALLFAVCGIAVHLGAAATFDPMALFLLVLALYAAVRMRDGRVRWLLLCPLALAGANAAKYSTIAWDPVIVATIVLYGWSKGRAQAICLATSVMATVAVVDFGILLIGGPDFASGALVTTIYGSPQFGVPTSSLSVLAHAFLMIGLIVLIAIAGVWVSIVKKMPPTATAFLCLLVLAALIAPLEQARVHQLPSLDENMGFGLPFAALGAGYALGAWRQWLGRQRHWGKVFATTAAVLTVITMLVVGRVERVQFRGPGAANAASVVAAIRQNYVPNTQVLHDSTTLMEQYYLPEIPPDMWVRSVVLQSPYQVVQMQQMFCSGDFSVIVLRTEQSSYEQAVVRLLNDSKQYELALETGTGPQKTRVWDLRHPGSVRKQHSRRSRHPGQAAKSQNRLQVGC